MPGETAINQPAKYLLCNYRFSLKMIETIKKDIKLFMTDREKGDTYFRFMNWQKKENELLVLTMYAYADIPLPKTFDTAFEIDKPDNFVHVDYTITQTVFNGWMPRTEIARGHKHICVIEFGKEIPGIFNSLPLFDESADTKKLVTLGLCERGDFERLVRHQVK